MKRKGIHKPTIEDSIELSNIEIMHPGGFDLSRRAAELAGLRPGLKVLEVSCGRGAQSIYCAKEFGVEVVGIDIDGEMIRIATENAKKAGVHGQVVFATADSQNLHFEDNSFDVVINECAVGIPDDSQKVVDEMGRVVKQGGIVVMSETIWRKRLSPEEKNEFSERYGSTVLESDEWISMLKNAGITDIISESDEWSKPERFWKVRKDRDVKHYLQIMSLPEKFRTAVKVFRQYGVKGVLKAFENEKIVFKNILDGKLGYCLYKGIKEG